MPKIAGLEPDEAALVLLVAVEGAHAYSAFLPSIFTIRAFDSEGKVRDIRAGEALASAFVFVLGLITAVIIDSPLPIAVSIGTAVAMIGVYEWALRGA